MWGKRINESLTAWRQIGEFEFYNTEEIWGQIDATGFAAKPGSSVLLGRAAVEMLRDTDLGENAFEIEPPLLVCHGTNDERIPCSNTQELMARLLPGRAVTYMEFEGASHSFRPAEHRQRVAEVVVDWLLA